MKKQKKPIFLGAVFILLLAIVVAFNFSTFAATDKPAGQDQQQQQQQTADTKKQPENKQPPKMDEVDKAKEELASQGSGVLEKADSDDEMTNIKGRTAIKADQPKIMAPVDIKAKPVTSTDMGSVNSQGQWYAPESGVK